MAKIDFTYIDVLSEDDLEFKKEYLETFRNNVDELTQRMSDELSKGDYIGLGKTAHQLKPTAKMIQLACGDTLEHLQHNPKDATKETIEAIKKECDEAYDQLAKWAES